MPKKIFNEDAFEMLLRIRLDGGTIGFFNENKEHFKEVVTEPLKMLAEELEPTIKGINSGIITKPTKVVSRPYRDARFTKGQPPVRDYMFMFYKHELERNYPLRFYVRIMPEGMRFGMGIMPAPSFMKAEYKRILANPAKFLNIIDSIKTKKHFNMHENRYIRPPFTSKDPRIMEWLYKKNFWYLADITMSEALSDELPEIISSDIVKFADLYNFLLQ